LDRQLYKRRSLNSQLEHEQSDANTEDQFVDDDSSDETGEEEAESIELPKVAAPLPPVVNVQPASKSTGAAKSTKATEAGDEEDWQDFWTEVKP
jgi:hypothetical protein